MDAVARRGLFANAKGLARRMSGRASGTTDVVLYNAPWRIPGRVWHGGGGLSSYLGIEQEGTEATEK